MDEPEIPPPRPSSNGDAPSGEVSSSIGARVVQPARRRVRVSVLASGAIVGISFAVLVALAATIIVRRSAAPVLNEQELQRAEQRWRAQGPSDYDMEVRVTGRQPSDFHVEVRRGRPVLLTRNGNATPQRMWDVWTVDGLFDTIHQEIELADNPAGPFGSPPGSPPGSQVVERAAFDERLGYPRRYQRIVMGTPLEVAWEVVEFRELAAAHKSLGAQKASAGKRRTPGP